MREIKLSNGMVTLVDDEDWPLIKDRRWYARRAKRKQHDKFYAATSAKGGGGCVDTHRVILGLVKGDNLEVDHIDGNGLNNRRSNLRLCTARQNQANKETSGWGSATGFRGVYRQRGKFKAEVSFKNKTIRVGTFATAEEAARAWDEAASRLYGDFARLNFPKTTSPQAAL